MTIRHVHPIKIYDDGQPRLIHFPWPYDKEGGVNPAYTQDLKHLDLFEARNYRREKMNADIERSLRCQNPNAR